MDIVLHVADLDHCFDVGKAIQETFRVLKPGGRTIILLENRGRLSNDIRRLFNREISHGVEHLYYFTVEDIQTLVEPYGTIEFLRSYGFLLGFDLLSRFLSREVIEVLATLSDRVLGKLFATKGQHFVVCASKKEDGAAATIRFLCPQCGTGFAWGDKTCKSCLREIRWIREDMVDMLAEELK
jgi:SAM-dependent methyltransferase